MMVWLDTNQSKKGKPNENYARELMELFSLGIGHYTEQDIREAARAFTGWDDQGRQGRLQRRRSTTTATRPSSARPASWKRRRHRPICLEQQACPYFIVGKLFRFLVSETIAGRRRSCSSRWPSSSARATTTSARWSSTMLRSNLFFSPAGVPQRGSSRRSISPSASSAGLEGTARHDGAGRRRWKGWARTCSTRRRSRAGTAAGLAQRPDAAVPPEPGPGADLDGGRPLRQPHATRPRWRASTARRTTTRSSTSSSTCSCKATCRPSRASGCSTTCSRRSRSRRRCTGPRDDAADQPRPGAVPPGADAAGVSVGLNVSARSIGRMLATALAELDGDDMSRPPRLPEDLRPRRLGPDACRRSSAAPPAPRRTPTSPAPRTPSSSSSSSPAATTASTPSSPSTTREYAKLPADAQDRRRTRSRSSTTRSACTRRWTASPSCCEEQALCVVQGVGYPNPNQSHFRSMDIWQAASTAETLTEGWIGKALKQLPAAPAFHLAERQRDRAAGARPARRCGCRRSPRWRTSSCKSPPPAAPTSKQQRAIIEGVGQARPASRACSTSCSARRSTPTPAASGCRRSARTTSRRRRTRRRGLANRLKLAAQLIDADLGRGSSTSRSTASTRTPARAARRRTPTCWREVSGAIDGVLQGPGGARPQGPRADDDVLRVRPAGAGERQPRHRPRLGGADVPGRRQGQGRRRRRAPEPDEAAAGQPATRDRLPPGVRGGARPLARACRARTCSAAIPGAWNCSLDLREYC